MKKNDRSPLQRALDIMRVQLSDLVVDEDDKDLFLRYNEVFSLKICKKEMRYELSFEVKSPETNDAFYNFEDQYCLFVLFAFIKSLFGKDFVIESNSDYPYSYTTYVYSKKSITPKELVRFFSAANAFELFLPVLLDIKNTEELKLEKNKLHFDFLERLEFIRWNLDTLISLEDIKKLGHHLSYVFFLNHLPAQTILADAKKNAPPLLPHNYVNAKVPAVNRYTDSDYTFSFSTLCNFRCKKDAITKFYCSKNYLFFIHRNKILVTYNSGFKFVRDISSRIGDPWNDQLDITLYVTSTNSLVISNSILTVEQKAYIQASPKELKRIIEKDLIPVKKWINSISDFEIFDPISVVRHFIDLVKSPKTTEKELENFLFDNYKIIFGSQYDIARQQIRLLDSMSQDVESKRIIDLALHDKIANDWVFIELKKPIKKQTTTTRKIPCWRAEPTRAISQIRYYEQLLNRTENHAHLLANYNIEYNSPGFEVIIGEEPDDNFYSCQKQDKDILIRTYSILYQHAKERLEQATDNFLFKNDESKTIQ